MAGVSAGTVDRVLHNRGDVSRASRDKVQKVLDEIDYHPNMFAIGLAAKKRYHIVCIIPYYIEHDYWHSVAAGIDRAAQELRLAAEHKNLTIHDVVLHKEDTAANEEVLDAFFSGHPKATLGVVFNSRVYQVADYLQKKNLKLDALVGYDLLQKNVEHLKNGEVNYLIGQRPGLQGYCGIKALCNHVVFKKPVTAVKYMPIDILMKENIDFYFEFE